MSLQLELVEQYILLKASQSELDRLEQACKLAQSTQIKLVETELQQIWKGLWDKWIAEYPGKVNLKLTREHYYSGGQAYYEVAVGPSVYSLVFKKGFAHVEIMNSDRDKCRLDINPDGTHEGCARDGCEEFDLLIAVPENLQFILSFWTDVHVKMAAEACRLYTNRL
jgi:hypothetical protein